MQTHGHAMLTPPQSQKQPTVHHHVAQNEGRQTCKFAWFLARVQAEARATISWDHEPAQASGQGGLEATRPHAKSIAGGGRSRPGLRSEGVPGMTYEGLRRSPRSGSSGGFSLANGASAPVREYWLLPPCAWEGDGVWIEVGHGRASATATGAADSWKYWRLTLLAATLAAILMRSNVLQQHGASGLRPTQRLCQDASRSNGHL